MTLTAASRLVVSEDERLPVVEFHTMVVLVVHQHPDLVLLSFLAARVVQAVIVPLGGADTVACLPVLVPMARPAKAHGLRPPP